MSFNICLKNQYGQLGPSEAADRRQLFLLLNGVLPKAISSRRSVKRSSKQMPTAPSTVSAVATAPYENPSEGLRVPAPQAMGYLYGTPINCSG